jgi:hypothetical protein
MADATQDVEARRMMLSVACHLGRRTNPRRNGPRPLEAHVGHTSDAVDQGAEDDREVARSVSRFTHRGEREVYTSTVKRSWLDF